MNGVSMHLEFCVVISCRLLCQVSLDQAKLCMAPGHPNGMPHTMSVKSLGEPLSLDSVCLPKQQMNCRTCKLSVQSCTLRSLPRDCDRSVQSHCRAGR